MDDMDLAIAEHLGRFLADKTVTQADREFMADLLDTAARHGVVVSLAEAHTIFTALITGLLTRSLH